jgi:hypothetical protein
MPDSLGLAAAEQGHTKHVNPVKGLLQTARVPNNNNNQSL